MAVGVLLSVTGVAFAADTIAWDKTFPRSDKVNHEKVSFYSRDRRQGLGDTMSNEDMRKVLEEVAEQRWNEFQGGEKKYIIGTPESIAEDSPAVAREFYDYYRTKRGHHPRSTTAMSRTNDGALMNFFPSVQASEPKELYTVPTARHVDLYDQLKYIPFDKRTSFPALALVRW